MVTDCATRWSGWITVLAKANRIVKADDFRVTVRRGRRATSAHALLYVAQRDDDSPTRFGFIVSKSVGNSVVRHRVTRQLRAIAYERVRLQPTGADVIVRALPGSSEASWTTLHSEIIDGLERSASKR